MDGSQVVKTYALKEQEVSLEEVVSRLVVMSHGETDSLCCHLDYFLHAKIPNRWYGL